MLKTVLFDLDGTLTDSGPGIRDCLHYAMKKMGFRECTDDELQCFIGPPMIAEFKIFCGYTQEEAERATAYFREKYTVEGIYNNIPYPGIRECLAELKRAGLVLAVCTSKPQRMAETVLDHFGMTGYFDYIVGPKKDGNRPDKFEVITEALALTGHETDKSSVVLVGDRKYDAMGAALCGIECVGVSYGYAEEGEFGEYGVNEVAKDTKDLCRLLLARR